MDILAGGLPLVAMSRALLSEHAIIAGVGMERDKPVDPGLSAGRTLHFDYLGFVLAGRGSVEMERGQGRSVESGSVMALPARRWHAFNPAAGTVWTEWWLLLRPGRLPPPLAELWPGQALLGGVRDPEVTLAWEALYDAWFFRPVGWSERAVFQLHRLLMAVRMAGSAPAAAQAGGALRRLHQRLYSRIADPSLDLQAMARQEHMSYDAYRRQFRRLVGQAPKSYFLELKMAYAKELLMQPGLAVAEVGRRVGLVDPYYFSRLFRRKTGRSPLQFRRSILGVEGATEP